MTSTRRLLSFVVRPVLLLLLALLGTGARAQNRVISFSYQEPSISATVGRAIPPDQHVLPQGVAPLSYSISPSGLPRGLAISQTTGVISGTPTAGSRPQNYTVTATLGRRQTAQATVRIGVLDQVTYPSPVTFTVGHKVTNEVPTDAGGTVSLYVLAPWPPLPPGLAFNSKTGSISGTPTAPMNQQTYTL